MKLKSILVIAGIVLATLFMVNKVLPENIKSYFA